MNMWIFAMGLIAAIVLLFGIFAIIKFKKQKELRLKYPGYPKGFLMEYGTGIGVAIGAGIGAAIGNIAIGVAIGVAIGAAIGSQLERKHKDEIRPLTVEEKKIRRQTLMYLSATIIVALIIFLVAFIIGK